MLESCILFILSFKDQYFTWSYMWTKEKALILGHWFFSETDLKFHLRKFKKNKQQTATKKSKPKAKPLLIRIFYQI